MLKILTLIKQLPDGDINPFDACALEEALRIPDAEVTVLSMGRPSCEDLLLRLSRLGTKRNILLTDSALAGSDTLCTAYALSQCVKKLSPDVVFCGRQSIDGDTAQVGSEVAVMCGLSLITNALSVGVSERGIECETRFGKENVSFPALVTVERINTLRFPRLTSKKGVVEKWSCDDAGIDKAKVGLRNSPTKVLKTFESTVGRRSCKFVDKSELMNIILENKDKQRLKVEITPSEVKLPEVWCIGEKPMEKAMQIAEKVRVIESTDVTEIAELARAEKPSVILWDSGIWGRRYAPQVAAMLETGLCADCTALETDGKKLYMYRPAFAGSIMAKIECRTMPQMATVRTAEESSDNVIIGAGLGCLDILDKVKSFATDNGFGFSATRAVVDKGLAPYSEQVGLTGKVVSPNVYVALGVSGAVQHTCAIEQAGVIIAVNCDKNARIFDFADFGIVCDVKDLFV
ncbi:MAG: FAD-binding protein [Clostridia bacterium]|nr:FAD-binding protein [Clostridia bacterium]